MKTKTKTKTKPKPKLRARKMFANYHVEGYVCLYSTKDRCMNSCAEHVAIPVAVIPLDDVDALVQVAAEAYFNAWNSDLATRKEAMRAALAAIGVLPRTRKGGAK